MSFDIRSLLAKIKELETKLKDTEEALECICRPGGGICKACKHKEKYKKILAK